MTAAILSHIIAILVVYNSNRAYLGVNCFRLSPGPGNGSAYAHHSRVLYSASEDTRTACRHRVGLGYDLHRLVGPGNGGKIFKLGGVFVENSNVFVLGHSDGDAVLHAVADAVLGAVGRGDIGEHFSDLDSTHEDLDSRAILEFALAEASRLGYRPCSVDLNIILQRPRLGRELKRRICESVGSLLGSGVCVNVKAKTNEGLDALGRGEAIACQSVALLEHV
ncbi:2-C-methyl-D-erythritol 2,4-cyclodiphosphate synthase [Babesia caballi]|uniref:2-C-methyl-D-erythritol 2,4-cyclodiphosphate synthase n=1 Tax=Babesia caballi TaxID=5871 RepID=A0AAV4LZB7_BABCB|nr:2-C-methyl-D-erythritol 2,4-cyclodiphosphate synthase [Babesia caballi]